MERTLRTGPSLLASLVRFRLVVSAVTVLAGLAGYAIGSTEAVAYVASARVFLADPNLPVGGEVAGPRVSAEEYVPRQRAIATSRGVLQAALDAAGESMAVSDLRDRLEVEASVSELSLTVHARGPTGEEAAELATAVAESYQRQRGQAEQDRAENAVVELDAEIAQLEAQRAAEQARLETNPADAAALSRVEALTEQIIGISARVRDTRLAARLFDGGVDVIEQAQVPEDPVAPRPRVAAVLFTAVGFLAAWLWAYWYAARSQRVVGRNDPEEVLGAPLLGEIPRYRIDEDNPLLDALHVPPMAAEAYEFVLSSIEYAMRDVGATSVMITSTLPRDGKTTTALHLAVAASRDQRRVVLVDADLRARGLTRLLGAEERPGLSDAAATNLSPRDVIRRYRFSESSTLPVVAAGTRRGDPAALLRTAQFRRTMQELRDATELLIVDASPLLAVADATIVAPTVQAAVLVVSHGTPMAELVKVKERLTFMSTPLIGYMYNRSEGSSASSYGYGYGEPDDERSPLRLRPRRRPADTPAPADHWIGDLPADDPPRLGSR